MRPSGANELPHTLRATVMRPSGANELPHTLRAAVMRPSGANELPHTLRATVMRPFRANQMFFHLCSFECIWVLLIPLVFTVSPPHCLTATLYPYLRGELQNERK